METEIDKNFNWYRENLNCLMKNYKNQYVVIMNKEVIFSSNSKEETINFARNLKLGEFIIQKCEKEKPIFLSRAVL